MLSKTVNFCKENEKDLFLAAVILLVALASFGLGRLSKIREAKVPITIENARGAAIGGQKEGNTAGDNANLAGIGAVLNLSAPAKLPSASSSFSSTTNSGKVVGSKTGTRYHYPWCAGAKSIKEENKIYFDSESSARQAGYSPASNCKGLK